MKNELYPSLGLQNKPEVKYYSSSTEGDYGGFSAKENTIYLNIDNIGDPYEVVDTVSHESRHCWQHEIAEKGDSPLAQEFKNNFENYINPEDDYRKYRRQPVEVDSREYAKDICGNIPKSNETINNDIAIKQEGHTKSVDLHDMKDAVFDKPTDFEAKRELSIEKRIEYANSAIKEINDDPELGEKEKAEEIKEILKDLGFDRVDIDKVESFKDRAIEVVQMNGNQTIYRRGYDSEGIGEKGYGSYWSDKPRSIEEARNELAILEAWGSPLTGEYEGEPSGVLALKGLAAPQMHKKSGEFRPGGGLQFFINTPDESWVRKVK